MRRVSDSANRHTARKRAPTNDSVFQSNTRACRKRSRECHCAARAATLSGCADEGTALRAPAPRRLRRARPRRFGRHAGRPRPTAVRAGAAPATACRSSLVVPGSGLLPLASSVLYRWCIHATARRSPPRRLPSAWRHGLVTLHVLLSVGDSHRCQYFTQLAGRGRSPAACWASCKPSEIFSPRVHFRCAG